jgi:transcriptional regulator GlxA family with amidase domain
VFNGANLALDARDATIQRASDGWRYEVTVASIGGGTIATESPIALGTQALDALPEGVDTLVVPGGLAVWHLRDDPSFVEPLRGLVVRCRRLITVCSGAALAAATGVLDGHRVTTHWARAEQLAAAHPGIEVDPDPIYLHAGRGPGGGPDVWTSAGVTAGIDCSLAVAEADHGTDIAQEIARWLVMYLRRPGGQSQFATPAWTRQPADGPIRAAQDLVVASPGGDHRIAVLAERVGMSHRHFVRRFTDEVAMSPARWIAAVRIDAARHELERTDDTVDVVARRCGFGTAETLRRSFHRHLGVGPDAYRARFSHHQPHPHPRSRPRHEDIA